MSSNNSIGKVLGACVMIAVAARVVPLFGQSNKTNIPLGRADFQKNFIQPDLKLGDLSHFNLNLNDTNNLKTGSFTTQLIAQGDPIVMKTDFQAALAQARAEHKPLVMFIYKTDGKYSGVQAGTMADASMNKFSGQAIFVKLDETSREGNFYLGQMNENESPVVGVFDVTRIETLEEIEHTTGSYAPVDFVPIFRRMMDRAAKSIEANGYAERVIELAHTSETRQTNAAEIFSLLQKSAALDNKRAANDLGLAYQQGVGTPVDYAKALAWYRKGADLGNELSLHNIAICCFNGWGTARNEATAAEYYRKAADKGVPQSMFQLGNCYLNGTGVNRDYNAAFNWFQKSADLGLPEAISNLAWMYENGKSVIRNPDKALELYRKAAELGDKWAQEQLAGMPAAR